MLQANASSNRITGITGALARTYAYDAAGNTTGYSTVSATYNNAGRLKILTNGSATETSTYNALGQRIEISGGAAGTVLYANDEAGHLLGEYDGTGTLIEETVWLGDIPVATLRPNGSAVSIYYIHSDQLNTPRQITRPSDNAQMWTWFSDPFGTDAANEDPASAGAFKYNLRLPGQVFDGQAGLHQNGFRDFDPATGRYSESDPIGLAGGTSTYGYGNGMPLQFSDPNGQLGILVNPYAVIGGVVVVAAICISLPNCRQGVADAAQNIADRLNQPMHADEEKERERGLPPEGVDPPVEGECKVGPASRPSMTVEIAEIAIGLPNFAEPTLLLVGDADAFRRLASELRAGREVTLGKKPVGARRATLQILPVGTGGTFSSQGSEFSWQISLSEADRVAQQLLGLANGQRPAHAYLDPNSNSTGVQILASVDEYDPARIL